MLTLGFLAIGSMKGKEYCVGFVISRDRIEPELTGAVPVKKKLRPASGERCRGTVPLPGAWVDVHGVIVVDLRKFWLWFG